MLELWLVAALGFLGSFGHCLGMCGPIAIAFSLASQVPAAAAPAASGRRQQLLFHLLLNLGRLVSYSLVGAAIGGLGSVLVAGGQVAGVGSAFRQGMTLFTGSLLILMGLRQVAPQLLPRLPSLHPLQGKLHEQLQVQMGRLAVQTRWWTPAAIGLAWGLVPCGFLYAAQIKAAETSSLVQGMLTMVAFGLGTLPVMVALGVSSAWFSRDRTCQLFQLGGWITLLIGILTLLRTGDLMVDYTGHLSLLCLALALVARPISPLWPTLLRFRRLLGVSACVLALVHMIHMLEHSWNWQPAAVRFMLPQHQWGVLAGLVGLMLMLPLTLTSTDQAQRWLGKSWRSLHLLSIPALLLGGLHCILAGSSYLGSLERRGLPLINSLLLAAGVLLVLALRSPTPWALLGLQKWYAPAKSARSQPPTRSPDSA